MLRIQFLKLLSVVILLSNCKEAPKVEVERPSPPNVIFIMADDLGYGDIGPYGQQKIKTPFLDKMAKEGLLFTQFYAGTSVCAPSRASLLTGQHTGHIAIRGNRQHGRRNGQMPLAANQMTLATLMKAAGYRTGLVGKWGLGNPGTSGDPLKQGFDFYYGYTDQILAHNYYPEYLYRNGEKEKLNNTVVYQDSKLWHEGLGSTSTEKNDYSNDRFTREALSFIEGEDRKSPFFLYLALTLPHDNGEQLPDELFEVPDQGRYASKPWTKNQKDYAAMVTRMDHTVGMVRATLDSLGIAEHTIVIFTSDNGPYRSHPTTAFFDSNGILRGGKRDLYEGGTRVPMLAVWPKTINKGRTSDHVGAFWDVMPTLAELVGQKQPGSSDGHSFLPTLLEKGTQTTHNQLYWEFHSSQGALQAVREGDYKYISFRSTDKDSIRQELYKLSEDLGELQDLSTVLPERVRRMDSIANSERTTSEFFQFPIED